MATRVESKNAGHLTASLDYGAIYRKAHNHAVSLCSDAELLLEKGSHSSAYFLAVTGLEEISKSQLAADVVTRWIDEATFQAKWRDHEAKIERMAWATLDAEEYSWSEYDEEGSFAHFIDQVDVSEFTPTDRLRALYTDVYDGSVRSPDEVITVSQAASLVHVLRVAIQRIVETEVLQGRIGTKGFMK